MHLDHDLSSMIIETNFSCYPWTQALDLVEMLRREEEMLVAVQAAKNEVSPLIYLWFTWDQFFYLKLKSIVVIVLNRFSPIASLDHN